MRRIGIPALIVAILAAAALFVVFRVIGGSSSTTTTPAAPTPLASSALPSATEEAAPEATQTPEEATTEAPDNLSSANDAAVASATTWITLFTNASSADKADSYSWLEEARPVLTDDYYDYLKEGGTVDNPLVFEAAHQYGLSQKPDITCIPMIDDGASTDGDNMLVDCSWFSTTVDAAGNDFDITKIDSVVWPYDGSVVTQATFGMERADDGTWKLANILW